jgi:hypothetical protein
VRGYRGSRAIPVGRQFETYQITGGNGRFEQYAPRVAAQRRRLHPSIDGHPGWCCATPPARSSSSRLRESSREPCPISQRRQAAIAGVKVREKDTGTGQGLCRDIKGRALDWLVTPGCQRRCS